MKKVHALLPSVLLGKSPVPWLAELIANWDSIMKECAPLMKVANYKYGTLYIAVEKSYYISHFYLMADQFIAHINAALDKPYVKKLLFIAPKHIRPSYTPLSRTSAVVPVVSLPAEHARALAEIKDADLAAALKKIYALFVANT